MTKGPEIMENRLKLIEKAWMVQSESLNQEKESMLAEIISFYNQAETDKDRRRVLECLSKWNTLQNLLHDGVTGLVEFLQNNAEKLCKGHAKLINQLLSIPSVKHHLKLNEKKVMDLVDKIVSARKPSDEETILVLNNLLSIGLSTEKGVSVFLRKMFSSLAKFFKDLQSNINLGNSKQQTMLILKNIFNKTGCQAIKETLQACFDDVNAPPKKSPLFLSLQNCYKADFPIELKTTYFKFIFQALLTAQLEDTEILKIFLIVSYLIGIPADLQNSSKIDEILGTSHVENDHNLLVWTAMLEVIAKRPLNLNFEVNQISFANWLKSVTLSLIKRDNFGLAEIKTLTALVLLDSSLIEPSLSKIFKKMFRINLDEVTETFEEFLLTTLGVFARLQRTGKLLQKLLSAIADGPTSIATHQILSDGFLNQLGKNAVVISSSQALNLIQLLISQFEKCRNLLQQNQLNTTLLETVSLLFYTILANCRLVCSSLPRTIVEQFDELMEDFKENLSQFGTMILLRTHDRKIMQPYLRMCHIWGEYHVLINLYATKNGPPSLPIDATPSDLSPILPFLKGEQWSVLSERIANFGDHQCNLLLMKLLILKIRIAVLSAANSSVNLDAIAKYILEILKQNVHGLKIDHAMSPEEFGFVFNALPTDQAKTLVKILYEHLMTSDDLVFQRWIKNGILLENPRFVQVIFETIIRDIGEIVGPEDLRQMLKNVDFKSISEDLKASINAVLCEGGNYENKLNDRVRKSLAALASMPFGYIATFGDNPLIIVLGIMATLNSWESLLPVFEKLLSHTKALDNSFDISSCIRWLTTHVPDRALRAPIVQQLIVKSTAQQLKRTVKHLDEAEIAAAEKLATQIHLHTAIRKCWRQGSDPESTQINDVIGKQRKKLNKSLHSALENAADIANDCVLLDAYGIELMRLEREGKVDGIVALNFQSFLNKALKGVKKSINSPEQQSCLNFLTTVLKCSSALRSATSNQDLVFSIYKQLAGFDSPALWEHVCAAATEKEFLNIMKDVSTNIQLSLCPVDSWELGQAIPKELKPLVIKISENRCSKRWSDYYINLWKLFLEKSTGEKRKCCLDHLKGLLNKPETLLPNADRNKSESLLKWMKFLHHVVSLSILTIRPDLEDYVMDVIMAFPESGTDFQEHFVTQLNIIGALIAPQKIPIVRKMHMIFLVYQKLVRWLSRECDVNGNLSADDVSSRALAAFHLEKWIGLLVQRKDEFRVLPLYITELINFIASVTVYPAVKVHIRNAIFHLLAVLDEQQVKTVARNLTTGSQQILTNIHSEFMRFHKYKGKI